MQIEFLSPSLIDVPSDARKPYQDAITALAESFGAIGQRQPVEVIAGSEGRYRLVFGVKRLGAALSLGIDVMAIVRQPEEFASDADIRLAAISETLYRHQLTALQRSIDIADWCAIWRAAHPVKRGPKPKSDNLVPDLALNSDDDKMLDAEGFSGTFNEAAQRFLNISRREVFRSIKIAGIAADLRERIGLDDVLADNQQALLDIAAQPYERATRIVELIVSGEATSFANAIEIIDQLPRSNTPAPWERVNDRFSRLKLNEQDAFFNINESSVMRWVAERKATRR